MVSPHSTWEHTTNIEDYTFSATLLETTILFEVRFYDGVSFIHPSTIVNTSTTIENSKSSE
jgi:hypothetical protein